MTDVWPVGTKPLSQWMIEDTYGAGRPDWDASGATFVTGVAPFEWAKLRMSNSAHSALAVLGYLAGYETVADAMATPNLTELARGLMLDEAAPTLPRLSGLGIAGYTESLLNRFRNPALYHRTWQVATDSSQKLPQRVQDRLAARAPFGRLALGIAGWMRYVMGTDERGRPIDVRDPLAASLRDQAVSPPASVVHGLLRIEPMFGTKLSVNAAPRHALAVSATVLLQRGAAATTVDLCDR